MFYTQSHEWIKVQENRGTIGITEQATCELGEIVYVECPIVGNVVQKGEVIAVLESTKAAVDIYSPLSGVILEINSLLQQQPQRIHQDPEEQGWICRITLTDPEEINSLLSKEEYLSQSVT